jgi:NADPH-dependent ferric siderophore reductase
VSAGDDTTFLGPRGQIELVAAERILAITDESGLPAIAAVTEHLNQQVHVIAEILDADERYPMPSNTTVNWVLRGEHPPGTPTLLLTAVDELTDHEPEYAYVLGESRVVAKLREELGRFGLARNDIYAKGYWNLNSRPER